MKVVLCERKATEVATGCSLVEWSQEEREEPLLQVSAPQPVQNKATRVNYHPHNGDMPSLDPVRV